MRKRAYPADIDALVRDMSRAEPDASRFLRSFDELVDRSVGIVRNLRRERDYYSDEPKFLCYRADLAPTASLSDGGYVHAPAEGGRSTHHDRAVVGALFEAMERYCLSIYRQRDLVRASHAQLESAGRAALDPVTLSSHEKTRDPAVADALRHAPMAWTPGFSYRLRSDILVPAQSVYLPYVFNEGEPVLRDPLTTGAAAGLLMGSAVLRGLLEVIERDAIMVTHYRSLSPPRLDLDGRGGGELDWVIQNLRRYQLDLSLYDIRLDLPVPAVLAKIIDRSGVGPSMTVASKAAFDVHDAVKGAIFEAACFRRPMRTRLARARQHATTIFGDLSRINSLESRSYVWIQPEMIEYLEYLDRSPRGSTAFTDCSASTPAKVRALIENVIRTGHDLIVVDVTTSDVATFGATVVKTIVPGLQPMHLDEQYRTWTRRLLAYGEASERALPVSALNQVPHPFL
ncbi:YcaO-like family protein [Pendulispora albinea]|uniref:YcaO-like family protein n=1 Tax=Pendulispora albinea TaxID=2741071 RepID=A0ABZ2M007_9BACT